MSTKELVPIRVFKSDFLERFTHVWPWQILAVWVPVAVFFMARAIFFAGKGLISIGEIVVGFVLGVIIWTFAEYALHRWVFHFTPRNAWQEKVSFLFHGVHHKQPMCKSRLVMPLALSIPLSIIFFAIFYLFFNVLLGSLGWMSATFSGFVIGYLWYDISHYAFHHFKIKNAYLKKIRGQHMRHHGSADDKLFGVSSPLWDYIFRTTLKKEK